MGVRILDLEFEGFNFNIEERKILYMYANDVYASEIYKYISPKHYSSLRAKMRVLIKRLCLEHPLPDPTKEVEAAHFYY
jgi:hypothetical protein